MKISGFTFVKNANKLFIPAREAIASVLPVVDEFVVALGKGDADDTTEADILSLNSDKIRIIPTRWESEKYPRNTIFAQQTDVAKEACTGDWLFYIQCDEALHEKYHSELRAAFQTYLNDKEVEGLVFKYRHFWGDFEHYNPSHVFYKREIRVIRNLPQIHSWRDAQSFRYHTTDFDYSHDAYLKKEGTRKLKVAQLKAEIYHYGWVRPPDLMIRKQKDASHTFRGRVETEKLYANDPQVFDYGPMKSMPRFKGSHPGVMQNWLTKIYWKDQLREKGRTGNTSTAAKHERWKYRLLTWVETHLLGGRQIGEFKNFTRIR